ncbi:nicotinamide phosphoribosyltransferase [Spiroplasma litorale]|uniref:Nicotinamide phosphoribosyltransferase n=1 Tax=Spiroplasma litorale TaxID=216942 RepID=A0A0K1W1S0_9MOLU|nr:nicotinamide phosphoribosyltransferase domain-containing protein [Spiroplasma litorale]AKX34052.1 nicotinamide phosphoribosyltransferase [Spiroplasma litorale]
MISLFKTDGYKIGHNDLFPENTTFLFANITPKKFDSFNKDLKINKNPIEYIYSYGVDYTINKLKEEWNNNFFKQNWADVIEDINKLTNHTNIKFSSEMIKDFKYLHSEIKKLPIDFLTIEYYEKKINKKIRLTEDTPLVFLWNTNPRYWWLVDYIETWFISELWPILTSGNVSYQLKKLALKYSIETCDNENHVKYQFHDYSQKGICTNYGSIKTGIGHLMNFVGSENLPSIKELSNYLTNFIVTKTPLIGSSIYALDNSIIFSGSKEGEYEYYEKILDKYPDGDLSIYTDASNIINLVEVYIPKLKDRILKRNGKTLIKLDLQDSLDFLIGKTKTSVLGQIFESEKVGLIKYLDKLFGHTINNYEYKVLNEKVGIIVVGNITYETSDNIFSLLKQMGYATSNILFGIDATSYCCSIKKDSLNINQKITFAKINNKNVLLQRESFKLILESSKGGLVRYLFDDLEEDYIKLKIIDGLSISEWKKSLPIEKLDKIKWLF